MIRNVEVSAEESAEILREARRMLAENNRLRHVSDEKLPMRLRREIEAALEGSGGLSIGPFLYDEGALAPTPRQAVPDGFHGSAGLAAHTLSLVAQSIGPLLTYPDIKQAGILVQNIFPAKGREKEESAASSKADLSWHTEHARKDFPPDYLAIFCLRNPSGVGTNLTRFSVDGLEESLVAPLRSPEATTFACRGVEAKQPVISGDEKGPRVRFDPTFQQPANARVKKGLAALTKQANQNSFTAAQIPGRVLVFSNRILAHGRGSFRANFDGRDRWLLRAMIGPR